MSGGSSHGSAVSPPEAPLGCETQYFALEVRTKQNHEEFERHTERNRCEKRRMLAAIAMCREKEREKCEMREHRDRGCGADCV